MRASAAFSAASLATFSRTGFGVPSTRSLASLRAQGGELAHDLDDLDLLLAGAGEDDVELVLLLGGSGVAATLGRTGGSGDGRGGGDVELLLEGLHELRRAR